MRHRKLWLELIVKGRRRKVKGEKVEKKKLWKLNNEEVRKMYDEKLSSYIQATTGRLEPLHEGMQKAAKRCVA